MREALAVIGEDGLENLWEKHTRLHHELWAGLKEMGLEPFVENPAERLTTVNCIKARGRRRPRGWPAGDSLIGIFLTLLYLQLIFPKVS